MAASAFITTVGFVPIIQNLKGAIKSPLVWFLRIPAIRSRMILEIKQHYYSELEFNVPLSHGYQCPISLFEHWCSFSEIFFGSEYDRVWNQIPFPARWLDLGCHAGYFSLYVAWLRKKNNLNEDFRALLVDGDSRCRAAVEKLMNLNGLNHKMQFEHGAIAREPGELLFSERGYMSSSVAKPGGQSGLVRRVPVISEDQIIALLPPPYDLVKIDVEGSEFDFLTAYPKVLDATKYLLLEWHSWHSGGGGKPQIEDVCRNSGFTLLGDVISSHQVSHAGSVAVCGVSLYRQGN
jgi:FkbM family methyltransferase